MTFYPIFIKIMMNLPLVLASTSPYRKAILKKFAIPFETASPDIDETALPKEHPEDLVQRLAQSKAKKVAQHYPNHLIIGSDQVASIDDKILGKPHTFENAMSQLEIINGRSVTFYTGLSLYNSQSKKAHVLCDKFHVHFKTLNEQQRSNYLKKEQPFNCAGSFKSEGLGIALFEKLEGDDPNSLIGLPLIRLIELLHKEGLDVLNYSPTD